MNTNRIVQTIRRKGYITAAHPQRHSTLRNAAQALSRRNADGAIAELLNEALQRLVALCYEVDEGGLCNVDSVTGRILIPLPWGRAGYARWGLKPQEGNIMRRVMFAWQRSGLPLFTYDRSRRAWFLNVYDFPTVAVAANWLTQHQIDIAMYRAAREQVLGRV